MDKTKRRELVQQMSTVTNLIPGSIGERRKMRQELEAMVHQIEAETADTGMNSGAGRIPSGFLHADVQRVQVGPAARDVVESIPAR